MKISIEKKSDRVEFFYEFSNELFSHALQFPADCNPNDDALLRVALFSRPANDGRYLIKGLTSSTEVKSFLERALSSQIDCPTMSNRVFESVIAELPRKTNLCFSGGFDSITSHALLGDKAQLLSIDFGGGLAREREFFEKFPTRVFKWNLREPRKPPIKKFNESLVFRH